MPDRDQTGLLAGIGETAGLLVEDQFAGYR
jgi:hypothetical protein